MTHQLPLKNVTLSHSEPLTPYSLSSPIIKGPSKEVSNQIQRHQNSNHHTPKQTSMDFKYQKAATGLDLSDVSETSSNSEESTTSAQGSKKGTRSSLSPLAEQSMRRLSLVEADHSHAEENKDEDMDMDADHEKDVDRNGAAKMDSDQKHKRPVQAVTKSWSQRGSAPENVDMDDDSDGQTFFATRAAFWTMVAAHGLPSACGPPKGMFEMEEEMGGAWRCVSNPFPFNRYCAISSPLFNNPVAWI